MSWERQRGPKEKIEKEVEGRLVNAKNAGRRKKNLGQSR